MCLGKGCVCKCIFFWLIFLGPYPGHVEVPGPGIKPSLELWPASQLRQHWILNPRPHQGTSYRCLLLQVYGWG